MKLFIIIYLGTKLVGDVGPLPYSMDECHVRVAEKLHEINSDPKKAVVAKEQGFALRCEFRESRPVLENPVTLK